MNDEVKTCTQCREAKPMDAFGSDKSRPDGKYSMCKACKNARNDPAKKKGYYEANKETLLAKQKLRNSDPVRKEQQKEYHKEYYQKNKDKRKAYIEANREKIAAAQKAKRERTKPQTAKYMKQYRKENAERIAEQKKAYNLENQEAIAEQRREYRANNAEKLNASFKAYKEQNKEKISKRRKAYRKKNSANILADNARYRAARKRAIPKFLKRCDLEKFLLSQIYKLSELITIATGTPHHVDHMWPLDDDGPHWSGNLQIIPATLNQQKWSKVDPKIKKTVQEALKWAEVHHEECEACNN